MEKIRVGDMVTIKRSKVVNSHPKWVKTAAIESLRLKVVRAIPMKGLLVRSPFGDSKVFNRSELRKAQEVRYE